VNVSFSWIRFIFVKVKLIPYFLLKTVLKLPRTRVLYESCQKLWYHIQFDSLVIANLANRINNIKVELHRYDPFLRSITVPCTVKFLNDIFQLRVVKAVKLNAKFFLVNLLKNELLFTHLFRLIPDIMWLTPRLVVV